MENGNFKLLILVMVPVHRLFFFNLFVKLICFSYSATLTQWQLAVHGTRDYPISFKSANDSRSSNVSRHHPFFFFFFSTSSTIFRYANYFFVLLTHLIVISLQ